jgi:copper oxidase (laccase) domain-containing protein
LTRDTQDLISKGWIKSFSDFPVESGISTRYLGDFGFKQPRSMERRRNIELLMVNECAFGHKIVAAHGAEIERINGRAEQIFNYYPGKDGMVIRRENAGERHMLAALTGDCPIIVMSGNGLVGIAHCGWRGVIAQIPRKMAMILLGNQKNPNIRAAIYGGICKDCYEFSQEMVSGHPFFMGHFEPREKGIGYLDLKGAIISQLIACGVVKNNITTSKDCSHHTQNENGAPLYYSHRREDHGRNLVFAVA